MKIQSWGALLPIQPIGVKDRDGSGRESQDQHANEQKKREDESAKKNFKATLEEVEAAVHSFVSETQSEDLEAVTEQVGLGLRVVLKDGSGAIVRQFSGEEFLKMREAASTSAGPRGRLFDRKA